MLIKSLPTLRKWYVLMMAGAVVLVMLAFMFSGTLAQEMDAPADNVQWQEDSGACQPYFVTVDRANVRACALMGCRVMAQVSRDQNLCVLGPSEESLDWLRVDLDPADAASPIYYISTQVVAPGAPGQAQADYLGCQAWLVDTDSVVVYACNQPGCAPLGTLVGEDWLCGYYYSVFPTWIYVVESDRGLGGWVRRDSVIPWGRNTGEPVPFVPTSTPLPGQATFTPVPRETLAPTVTPPPGPLSISGRLPACQQYFVSDLAAAVRSCAGAECPLVARLAQGEGVCVRGITDNPDWLLVSLSSETEDTEETAPLYAIEKSNVMPGFPPDDLISVLFADCEEFWGVEGTDNVNYRQCPSVTCPVMGVIEPGNWVCARGFGGQYNYWLRVDVPGGASGVWVNDEVMTFLTDEDLPEFAQLLQAQAEALTTPADAATPVAAAIATLPATDTPAPSATIQQAGPMLLTSTPAAAETTPDATATAQASPESTSTPETPACVPYLVSVQGATGANIRACASTTCDILEMYPQGASVCVLGVDPEDPNWLVVERSPEQPGEDLAYISAGVVAPQSEPASVIGITPQASTPIVLPTATAQPTLPVCEPGSSLAGCVTMTPTPVLTPIPENVPTGPLLAQEVKLADLGVSNLTLQSPAALAQFDLAVPETWVPGGNNVLYLNIDYFETRSSTIGPTGLVSDLITILNVTMDEQVIATISLGAANVGVQTLAIPLPLNILQDQNRIHTFTVELRAEDHCLANSLSQVLIKTDQSYFHLEFRESLPIRDLSLYPRPIYTQRFVDRADVLYLVLPANPTEHDIQTGMSLSAGLGSLTFNDLVIRVLTADAVDDTILRTNNLMLVGQIGTNALIDQYYAQDLFPSDLGADGVLSVAGEAVATTDGVVQIIPNPGNELLSVVAVTGQSPEALTKAAAALAGPPSVMGIGGAVAVVTDLRPVQRPPVGFTLQTEVTFSQLGYPLITLGGYGVSSAQVRFYLPANYPLTEDAYVDMEFNYSGLISNNRSSVALTMNNRYPIASAVLDAPTSQVTGPEGTTTQVVGGPYHLRARIPPDSGLLGEQNTLNITLTVGGDWECYIPDPQVAWFTVSGNSKMNLPRGTMLAQNVTPYIGTFPVPFNTQPDLRDVWFVLPDQPTAVDLEYAMRLVSRLGTSVTAGEGFAPRVSLGSALPEGTDLSGYNLIVFGQNTRNSFLASLNQNLPQPFVEGTDTLRQVMDDVVYRLPVGYEIGLLEILPSPWSLDRVILVITGTGDRGYANAAAVLNDSLYWRTELMGDVGYVSDNSISMVDTRVLRDREQLAEQIQDVLLDLEAQATEAAQATQVAQAMATLTTATPEPNPTLLVDTVVTVTPVPTLQVIIPTSPALPTPLFTQTPVPTVPTAIPTFEPLPPTALQPRESEPPRWLDGILVAAGVLAVATLAFGLVRLMRQDRRR